jgi:uncharacterized protein YqfA (UPF0365 family)
MPRDLMTSLDIFMRYTSTDGAVTTASHGVWDKQRFLDARQAEADKENAKARNEGRKALAKAEQITAEQYRRERK